MSANGSGVVVAGRDAMLSLALKRSGIPPSAEVTQAELLFTTLDRCQPRVLVLGTDLDGTYDPGAMVSNIAWLFPQLGVVVVRGADAPDPGQLPPGWQVFGSPPDYRRLAETVRRMLSAGGGTGHHPDPPASALSAPPAATLSSPPTSPPGTGPDPWLPRGGPAVPGGSTANPPSAEAPPSSPWPGAPNTGSAQCPAQGASARPAVAWWGRAVTTPRGGPGVEAAWGPAGPAVWPGLSAPQVVTVCSPKGGVGKTFVAVNLAAALASQGQEVLLLDWDLPSADVSIHLNLQVGPGVLDLINSGREMSPEVLREHLVRHPPSGLHILRGPARPEMAEFIGQEHLRALLASARAGFPVVVIDTAPSPCDEALCQALEGATRILLVVVQDPACLYQARVFLDLVPRLGIHRGTVGLVVNRYREGAPDVRDIQSFLGMAPAALLPDDPGADRSVMQGTPYVLRHTGPLATALFDLAQHILPMPGGVVRPAEKRRGWFLRRGGAAKRDLDKGGLRWEGF
ncbi:MAG: P-loop NTPase [Firmicutes bacterium]|nr:P-loop NTPase [Bacillota bacterium]